MLDSRDYMREPSFKPRWSVTLTLLAVNLAVFLLQIVSYHQFPAATRNSMPPTDYIFALSLEGLKSGWIWQLFTFQFMHGGWVHLLFNSWGLYLFGRVMEGELGKRNFLMLYFSSGVAGGLLQMLGAAVWPSHLGGPVVGASAGILGLIGAFATLYPDQMMIMIFPPMPLRARTMLIITVVTAILGMAMPQMLAPLLGNAAHAAHLGGVLMGVFYVRKVVHWQWEWPSLFRKPPRPAPPREFVSVPFGKSPMARKIRSEPAADISTEEFVSREVDPILDKISQHGIHSLTERERKILDAARKKMTR